MLFCLQDENKSKKGLAEVYEVRASVAVNYYWFIMCTFLLYFHFFFWKFDSAGWIIICWYWYWMWLQCFYLDNRLKLSIPVLFFQDEFVQKTDPASAPLSFSDEQKNEVQPFFSSPLFYLLSYNEYIFIVNFLCFIFVFSSSVQWSTHICWFFNNIPDSFSLLASFYILYLAFFDCLSCGVYFI